MGLLTPPLLLPSAEGGGAAEFFCTHPNTSLARKTEKKTVTNYALIFMKNTFPQSRDSDL